MPENTPVNSSDESSSQKNTPVNSPVVTPTNSPVSSPKGSPKVSSAMQSFFNNGALVEHGHCSHAFAPHGDHFDVAHEFEDEVKVEDLSLVTTMLAFEQMNKEEAWKLFSLMTAKEAPSEEAKNDEELKEDKSAPNTPKMG
jgi:hypothetical protein